MVQNIIDDVKDTQSQLGPSDTTNLVFKLFDQTFKVAVSSIKLVPQNIGDAFTLNHATNGVLGTANGIGGSQITLGSGDLGSTTLAKVVGDTGRIFTEMFRNTEFIDTVNTTATVDTSAFAVNFASSEILQTDVVAFESGTNIDNARIVIPNTNLTVGFTASSFEMGFPIVLDGAADTIEFSPDNGSNWETISGINEIHTFTNTGEKLKVRITANNTRTITIDDSTGTHPVQIITNE